MTFKIGLLGLGTVGSGTASILLNPEGRHPLIRDIEIKKIGVRSPEKSRQIKFPPNTLTTDLESIVNDPDIDIIVELIGGLEPARTLILMAIANGKHIVTANKAVIARYGAEIYAEAKKAKVYVLSEAAVGGGIPIIEPLKTSLGGNRLNTIIGIVNGTTNYILTNMTQNEANFEDVLTEAQQLGYAEAEPSADVDGFDAADKISILASLAFGKKIDRHNVYCEGIRNITSADINYADKLGFVIKLLAIASRRHCVIAKSDNPQNSTNNLNYSPSLELRVHPTFVPKSHPLANVNGVFNAILVEGEPLGQIMFYGLGAGAGATASAVTSDLINIVNVLQHNSQNIQLDSLLSYAPQEESEITPMEAINSRFYARFLCADVSGVIGHLGTIFADFSVSLESVVQLGFKDDLAEIVVVTHYVNEGNFSKAIAKINSLTTIKHIASIIRVL